MDLPLKPPLEPMLTKLARELPDDGFPYEPKWDRAMPWPTVSTPVTFSADDMPARLEQHGDLFRQVLELEQELPS